MVEMKEEGGGTVVWQSIAFQIYSHVGDAPLLRRSFRLRPPPASASVNLLHWSTRRRARSRFTLDIASDAQGGSTLTRYPQLMTTAFRGLASLRHTIKPSHSLHPPPHAFIVTRAFTVQTSRHEENSGLPDFKNIKFPRFPLGIAPRSKSTC